MSRRSGLYLLGYVPQASQQVPPPGARRSIRISGRGPKYDEPRGRLETSYTTPGRLMTRRFSKTGRPYTLHAVTLPKDMAVRDRRWSSTPITPEAERVSGELLSRIANQHARNLRKMGVNARVVKWKDQAGVYVDFSPLWVERFRSNPLRHQRLPLTADLAILAEKSLNWGPIAGGEPASHICRCGLPGCTICRDYPERGAARHPSMWNEALFFQEELSRHPVEAKPIAVFNRTYDRLADSWKMTRREYLDSQITGFIGSEAYKSHANDLNWLIGNPLGIIEELPEEYVLIRNSLRPGFHGHTGPPGDEWGVLPKDQRHARPLHGYHDTKQEAIDDACLFLDCQRTGYSPSAPPGREGYPLLHGRGTFDGDTIEFRGSGTPLKYGKNDPTEHPALRGTGYLRDEDGNVVDLTPDEIAAKGMVPTSRTIVAFHDDVPVGMVSNEWGVPGVWVIGPYQRAGIGLELLDMYAERGAEVDPRHSLSSPGSMGQATEVGRGLIGAYHRLLVERALAEGKPVPEEVLADYPDLNRAELV